MTCRFLACLCRCLRGRRGAGDPPRTTPGGSSAPATSRAPVPHVVLFLKNDVPTSTDVSTGGVTFDDPAWRELVAKYGRIKVFAAYPQAARQQVLVDRAAAEAKKRGDRTYVRIDLARYYVALLPERSKLPPTDAYCGLKAFATKYGGTAYLSLPARPASGSDAYRGPGRQPADSASGIGAAALTGKTNGATIDGSGDRLVLIDKGFGYPGIDDRVPLLANLPAGVVESKRESDPAHGAGVLGVLLGGAGATDLAGLAPAASVWRAPALDADGFEFIGKTILSACDQLTSAGGPGGVILVELETWDGSPIETDPFVYHAMQTARYNHQIVIEPAGNRAADAEGNAGTDLAGVVGYRLADPANEASDWIERSLDGADASPAIVVAAGASGTVADIPCGTRTPTSNFGALVDAWAWGDSIRTLTCNSNSTDVFEHPDGFGETSGAAAIVAGAVLLMQGLRREAGGAPLELDAVRAALRASGTPGRTELNGKFMPDLALLRDSLGGKTPQPQPD